MSFENFADALQAALARKCGPCTVCCHTQLISNESAHIPDGKDTFVRCPHQASRGCKVHDTRPDECRYYECAWKLGLLPEEARPDKVGFVFSLQTKAFGVGAWDIAFTGAPTDDEIGQVLKDHLDLWKETPLAIIRTEDGKAVLASHVYDQKEIMHIVLAHQKDKEQFTAGHDITKAERLLKKHFEK
jgi:hypothetical protein